MFERFRRGARRVVELAQEEARALGHDYLGTEHLLLGLVVEHEGVAARVLSSLGLTQESLRADIGQTIGPPEPSPIDPEALATIGIDLEEVRRRVEEAFGPGALERTRAGCGRGRLRFTPRAKKVLELTVRESRALGHDYVDTEHVLLGLIREGNGVAMRILERRGLSPGAIRNAVHGEIRRDLAS